MVPFSVVRELDAGFVSGLIERPVLSFRLCGHCIFDTVFAASIPCHSDSSRISKSDLDNTVRLCRPHHRVSSGRRRDKRSSCFPISMESRILVRPCEFSSHRGLPVLPFLTFFEPPACSLSFWWPQVVMSLTKPLDVVILRRNRHPHEEEYWESYLEYGLKGGTSTKDWSGYILANEGEVDVIGVFPCSCTYSRSNTGIRRSVHEYDGGAPNRSPYFR